MEYTLVIDQGTHASRAILFNSQGHIVEKKQQPIQLSRLDYEHIEQDTVEILRSVSTAVAQLDTGKLQNTRCCAISTQRSTVVAWHKQSGEALYPAISWQDRRAHRALEKLTKQQSRIRSLTGLPMSAHYGASKMHWLLQQVESVRQAHLSDQLYIAPLASWLLNRLAGEQPYLVDHSNAHRTLLFDIRTLDWSGELTELFQIPRQLLPDCKPLIHEYGMLSDWNIPVTAMCGDQTAALYALGTIDTDAAFINIGTGAFLLSPVAQPVNDMQLLCSIGWSDDTQVNYLLEGTVNGAGAALSWAQQQFPVDHLYKRLADWLAQDNQHTPIFLNSVGGIGSPWWKADAPPRFLDRHDTDIALKYVAVIESIAFLLANNIEAMQKIKTLKKLYVGGGLSQLDGLCQKLSDISQLPVQRLAETEATARGAAWLANNRPPHWPGPELDKLFSPQINAALKLRYKEFNREINSL